MEYIDYICLVMLTWAALMRTLRPIFIFSLSLAIKLSLVVEPTAAQFGPFPPVREESNVTIRVIDEVGKSMEYRLESFKLRNRSSVDLASHFKTLRGSLIAGSGVPYGTYGYSLCRIIPRSPLFISPKCPADVMGQVYVGTPEIFEVAYTLRNPREGGPPAGYVVSGKLEPMPAPSEAPEQDFLRIRFAPIDSNRRLDVPVDPSGDFRIYEALLGRYILIVVRGEEVLHTEEVVFDGQMQPDFLLVKMQNRKSEPVHIR